MGFRSGGDQGLSAVERAGPGLHLSWLFVAAKSPGDRITGCCCRPGVVRATLRRGQTETHHGQGQEDWFKGLALRAQLWTSIVDVGPQLPVLCLMMYSLTNTRTMF